MLLWHLLLHTFVRFHEQIQQVHQSNAHNDDVGQNPSQHHNSKAQRVCLDQYGPRTEPPITRSVSKMRHAAVHSRFAQAPIAMRTR